MKTVATILSFLCFCLGALVMKDYKCRHVTRAEVSQIVRDVTTADTKIIYLVNDLRNKPSASEICGCEPTNIPTMIRVAIDK